MNRNICKFMTSSTVEIIKEKIETINFIYETDFEVMKSTVLLPNNRMFLVKCGSGIINIEGVPHKFKKGNLFFAFQHEKIAIMPDEECEYMYIDFTGIRGEVLLKQYCISADNRLFAGFDGIIPMWYDALCCCTDENIDLTSEGIFLYTIARLTLTSKKRDAIVAKILEITEERFMDSELSVNAIADILSYSAKHISRVFRNSMGINYTDYLRNIRIKYAIFLLENGVDSIKNVAYLSGFIDPAYFSAVFKKTVGMSPKEYQKMNKKEKTTN